LRDPQVVSAAARYERLLLRLLTFTRVAVLIQAAVSLGLTWQKFTVPIVVAGLIVVLAADNVVLIGFHRRRGALDCRWLATLDVCIGMAALVVAVALLKRTANPVSDDVLYPYTVATLSVIGMVYRRFPVVLLAPVLTAAGYLTVTVMRFGSGDQVQLLTNATTYFAWGILGWFLAVMFRRLSVELDEARRAAVAREGELARERERSRHVGEVHKLRMAAALRELERERERTRLSRDLHDRVLQTLEFVGREGWISDTRMRDHVAAEAVWLRELVHSELDRPVTGLAAVLDGVVARQTDAGMRIEVNHSGLGAETLPKELIDALEGAVTELLTNVRKHAGTTRAVLRAVAAADLVTVTVLDRGCGFNPILVTGGIGLRDSVIERIRQVDGRVVVTSEPGVGTHVELSVPVPVPVPDSASAGALGMS
jgi:signal transduction histidine kinase